MINVSAMGTHPHTNQANAALNMLTRTSGLQLAKQHNMFMVSVDTGWVTDELPLKSASRCDEDSRRAPTWRPWWTRSSMYTFQ